jgi:hypothetical protein
MFGVLRLVIIVYRTSLEIPKEADVGLWELEARIAS